MDVTEIKNKKRTPKEAFIYNAAVLAGVAVVIGLMAVFKVGAWVPFLALCLWAMKITMDPKEIVKNYVGCAVGLTMGYLLRHSGELGTWAIVVFVVAVLCLFFTMLNQIKGLNFFFNDWTAVFCSVGTAMPYEWTICFDWLFAFILFGVSVMIAGHFMDKKSENSKEAESAPEAA